MNKYYSEKNNNLIKVAGIEKESIVDGPGIRYVIFTQGCPHNCDGCHNPQTHDYTGGKYIDTNVLLEEIASNPLLKGITLSGGEPFMQAKKLSKFVDDVHKVNKDLDVFCYTGFKYEDLMQKANEDNGFGELISKTDVLIDGKFDKTKMREDLMFRGSYNQRAIDIQETLNKHEIVERNFGEDLGF